MKMYMILIDAVASSGSHTSVLIFAIDFSTKSTTTTHRNVKLEGPETNHNSALVTVTVPGPCMDEGERGEGP
jgi:hypothetical protein